MSGSFRELSARDYQPSLLVLVFVVVLHAFVDVLPFIWLFVMGAEDFCPSSIGVGILPNDTCEGAFKVRALRGVEFHTEPVVRKGGSPRDEQSENWCHKFASHRMISLDNGLGAGFRTSTSNRMSCFFDGGRARMVSACPCKHIKETGDAFLPKPAA